MIPLNAVAEESYPSEASPDAIDEFSWRKGDFVGVVKPNKNRYEFYVRDLRREGPTIQGFGVDYSHAVNTVTQLLEALAKGR